MKMRLSDNRSHAEEFTANSFEEFTLEFLEAWNRFRDHELNKIPPYQTIKRARFVMPMLSLHIRDYYHENGHNSNKPWWVMVSRGGMFPCVGLNALRIDHGRTMWDHATSTERKCEELAKFLGYHMSGEDRLGRLLESI